MSNRLAQYFTNRREWPSDWCRVGVVLAFLLLLQAAGQPGRATAAGDKPAKKAAATERDSPDETAEKADAADDDKGDEARPGYRLEKVKEIVVWNEHNGPRHDSGTKTCNLSLLRDGKVVWERKDLEIPWEPNKPASRVVPVTNVQADTLRVEVTAWNEKGGGLAEVEVLDKTGTNLGLGGKVKTSASASKGDETGGQSLIDEVYDSADADNGYWLLPDGKQGWAEIELLPQKISAPTKDRTAGKQGKKKLSVTPMGAELYVTCEEAFDLYINGEHILSGHGRRCFNRHVSIANGDVITVRCDGASDKKGGFCFLLKFTNSGHFLSTLNGWKVYNPSNPTEWFQPDRVKPEGDPTKGTSSWADKEMKEESGGKPPQIWGTGKTCFLAMVADTKVKKIKMKPGAKKR